MDRATARSEGLTLGQDLRLLTALGSAEVRLVGITSFAGADGIPTRTLTTTHPDLFGSAERPHEEILVAVDDSVDVAAVAERLRSDSRLVDVEIVSGSEWADEWASVIRSQISFLSTVLTVFGSVALALSVILIFNTFTVAAARQSRELALVRVVGATRGQVARALVLQTAAVGLTGSIIGVGLGIASASLVRSSMEAVGIDLELDVSPPLVPTAVLVVVVGTTITVLAGFIPSWRSVRRDPDDALRAAATTDEPSAHWRRMLALGLGPVGAALAVWGATRQAVAPTLGGLACLVVVGWAGGPWLVGALARPLARLVALVDPTSASVAVTNLRRNPRRAFLTTAGVGAGVAIIAFFSVLAASIDGETAGTVRRAMRADLAVSSISDEVPTIPIEIVERLEGVPAIDVVMPVAMGVVALDGDRQRLGSVDPNTITEVWDLGFGAGDLRSGGVVLFEEAFPDTGIGDVLTAARPDGGTLDLPVTGLFSNRLPGFDAPDALTDPGTLAGLAAPGPLYVVFATGSEGEEQLADAATAVAGDLTTARISTKAQFADLGNPEVGRILALVTTVTAMAVVIAALGVANTLTLAVHERRRELAVLRAIGATPAQTQRLIFFEALLTSALGSVSGIGIGAFGAWVAIKALRLPEVTDVHIPQLALVALAAVPTAVGGLLAVLPARSASREDLETALAG